MALKAVSVCFGRLGNFRPGSGRFEAPVLARIPEKPLVSCLCVTENRQAFMPWLLWNYDRQFWNRRELIVVDSSDPPVTLPKREDIRLIHVAPGTSLGKKRNVALAAARGEVVAWFDDDDWQHPKRLGLLVPLLRQQAEAIGASFIGPSKSYFLDVRGHRCARYVMHRYAIFNGSIFYREMVRHARFPEDVLRTEDTRWIATLLRKRQGAALVNDHPTLFFWLSHFVNVTNANHVRNLPLDANELVRGLGSAWSDTPAQLAALRERLAAHPAKRPVRVELAEPRRLVPISAPAPREPPPPEPEPQAPRSELPKLPPQRRALAVKTAAASTAPPARTLSLYLASTRGRAPLDRPGYVSFPVSGSRYGWLDAVAAIAVHRRNEWQQSTYVGVFDAEASGPPEARVLAASLAGRPARGDVCVLGRGERRKLGVALGDPRARELARYLFERLSLEDSHLLERDVVSLESGWLATPALFADYVRNWLIPARTVLNNRHDPALGRWVDATDGPAEAGRVTRRILELLPSVAFSHEGRGVRALALRAEVSSP